MEIKETIRHNRGHNFNKKIEVAETQLKLYLLL